LNGGKAADASVVIKAVRSDMGKLERRGDSKLLTRVRLGYGEGEML
jgi:hypothetical protein